MVSSTDQEGVFSLVLVAEKKKIEVLLSLYFLLGEWKENLYSQQNETPLFSLSHYALVVVPELCSKHFLSIFPMPLISLGMYVRSLLTVLLILSWKCEYVMHGLCSSRTRWSCTQNIIQGYIPILSFTLCLAPNRDYSAILCHINKRDSQKNLFLFYSNVYQHYQL